MLHGGAEQRAKQRHRVSVAAGPGVQQVHKAGLQGLACIVVAGEVWIHARQHAISPADLAQRCRRERPRVGGDGLHALPGGMDERMPLNSLVCCSFGRPAEPLARGRLLGRAAAAPPAPSARMRWQSTARSRERADACTTLKAMLYRNHAQ